MGTLLKVTGVGKLISFYKYIYFNQPRLVTFTGIWLILMIGLTHMYVFPLHFRGAPYLGLSFAVLCAASLVSAINILRGSRRWGWALGAVISSIAFVSYILSRLFGLPGFPEAQHNWANPPGTVAMAFEAVFIATYISLISGVNVAWPQKRGWHD
jgi:hypothetical protein